MSWAADRQAKKEEDRAYSLLGIFGVSMPLLYGEGNRAFIRLQEEIIKETNDMSLFAWCDSTAISTNGSAEFRGILTTTPDHFRDCRDLTSLSDLRRGPEFSMTNKGLRLESRLFTHDTVGEDTYFLSLGIARNSKSKSDILGILLRKVNGGIFVRTRPDELRVRHSENNSRPLEKKVLFIAKQFTANFLEETVRVPGRDFRVSFDTEEPKLIVRVISQGASKAYWDPDTYRFVSRRLWEFEGCLEVETVAGRKFVVICGFDTHNGTWVYSDEVLRANVPILYEYEVADETLDGIPVTRIHFFSTRSVARKPAPEMKVNLQPRIRMPLKVTKGACEAKGEKALTMQLPNCKLM